ncbi:UNVERIFIED_CONTAM: hypothetical protein GTU68_026339 [Idotea baltica]|nr:hypothetical protein [Idotea baltica]
MDLSASMATRKPENVKKLYQAI